MLLLLLLLLLFNILYSCKESQEQCKTEYSEECWTEDVEQCKTEYDQECWTTNEQVGISVVLWSCVFFLLIIIM